MKIFISIFIMMFFYSSAFCTNTTYDGYADSIHLETDKKEVADFRLSMNEITGLSLSSVGVVFVFLSSLGFDSYRYLVSSTMSAAMLSMLPACICDSINTGSFSSFVNAVGTSLAAAGFMVLAYDVPKGSNLIAYGFGSKSCADAIKLIKHGVCDYPTKSLFSNLIILGGYTTATVGSFLMAHPFLGGSSLSLGGLAVCAGVLVGNSVGIYSGFKNVFRHLRRKCLGYPEELASLI